MSYPPQPPQQYPPPGAPLGYGAGTVVCPFCGGTTDMHRCVWCGRDPAAPRRPCQKCLRMVPTYEPICWNCGSKFKSDLNWKIPLIILLFVLAIVLSILIKGGF